MKKTFVLVIGLLLLSVGANAQSMTLDEAYAGWKKFATPSKDEPIEFCLASWIKRGDDNKKVSIEFVAFGKISEFDIKIIPLYVERGNDQKVLKEQAAGEVATTHQTSKSSSSRAEITVNLPIEPNANSMRIEWSFISLGKKHFRSHLVSMEDDPAIHFLAETRPKK